MAFLLHSNGESGGPKSDRDHFKYSCTRTFCDFVDEFVFGEPRAEIVGGSFLSL